MTTFRVLRFPPPIILLKVTLNTIKSTIQTTKNYSVNWNGNHQKRDEIDTNSHSFFFIYKILNGCNGLRPAQLVDFMVFNVTFNNIIGGGNRRTRRKQSTCLRSLPLSHKVVHLALGGS
jgi:hypothetical protein